MKQDTENLTGPFWHSAFMHIAKQQNEFKEHIKEWKARHEERDEYMAQHIESLEEHIVYLKKKYEDLQINYVERLKSVGMKDQDIKEFNEHWKSLEYGGLPWKEIGISELD
jgi:chromosome segregation ATPase